MGLSDDERANTVREIEGRLGEIFAQKVMRTVSRRVARAPFSRLFPLRQNKLSRRC